MFEIMIVMLSTFVGGVLGVLLYKKTIMKRTVMFGVLKINTTDPKKDLFKILIDTDDVEELNKHQFALLKIDCDSRK